MKSLHFESLLLLAGGTDPAYNQDAADCAHAAWGAAAGLAIFGGPVGGALGLLVFMVGTVGCVEYHT